MTVTGGASAGDHAEQRRKSLARRGISISDDEELHEAPPISTAYIWSWFCEVGPGGSDVNGPTPLAFAEIQSWADLTGTQLHAWEARLLRRLSVAYCQSSLADRPASDAEASSVNPKAHNR